MAERYAAEFGDELRHKPLDRALLRAFADEVGELGPVGDVGCGTGQIAAHLAGLGLRVEGVDLSDGMIAQARKRYPGLRFRQGSMLDLDVGDATWGGLVAFYSIIHLEPDELPRALAEFRRVLRPGGLALLSFHVGTEVRHVETMLGEPVSLDFHFLEPPAVEAHLRATGLTVEARLEREPYVAVEVSTRRAYLLARKPT